MKCISLWQPWATLIAIGAKKIETRSWKPPMERGVPFRLAIHAAKKWNGELEDLCYSRPFCGALRANECDSDARMIDRVKAARGHIVATCYLAGWDHTESMAFPITDKERAFGDYSPMRFAWYLEEVKALETPIPFIGKQGIFDVPDSLFQDGVS